MTPAEFDILWRIGVHGPLTATELRDLRSPVLHPFAWQNYASKLASLRRRGFVTKEDPTSTIWQLTDAGRELIRK